MHVIPSFPSTLYIRGGVSLLSPLSQSLSLSSLSLSLSLDHSPYPQAAISAVAMVARMSGALRGSDSTGSFASSNGGDGVEASTSSAPSSVGLDGQPSTEGRYDEVEC